MPAARRRTGKRARRAERRQRGRSVTEEPYLLAPEIKGLPLATVRRRAAAILVDLALLLVIGTPLLIVLMWVAVYLQSPAAAQVVVGPIVGDPLPPGAERDRAIAELLSLAWRREPGAVPPHLADALAAGDLQAVVRLLDAQPFAIDNQLTGNQPSYFDASANVMHIGTSALVGPMARWLGFGSIGMTFFTLLTWLGGGRTVGKWILGIRIVRLDGYPLSLWDAFGRAGGYAASTSTLMLGFIEAAWDPNRQALHDRVVGTVVVRNPSRHVDER